MKLSQKGVDFIKSFEGCRLEAYHGAAAARFIPISRAAVLIFLKNG